LTSRVASNSQRPSRERKALPQRCGIAASAPARRPRPTASTAILSRRSITTLLYHLIGDNNASTLYPSNKHNYS
jgi:hypothetical protein